MATIKGQVALLAVILLTVASCAAPRSVSQNAQQHVSRTSLLPTCSKILGLLPEAQSAHLRDLIQVEGQAIRKLIYWSELHKRMLNTPTDESEKIAFKTTLTEPDVSRLAQEHSNIKQIATQKVSEFVSKLKTAKPELGAMGEAQIRACAMGRMNSRLYEYRPKVSLLLQYYKRPHIIAPYIQRVQQCAEHHPIELLVNVDHPADHEAWAWAAHNTSGLVVPVFSNNIHEIRAYNRLAHLARSDLLVFLADDDLLPTTDQCAWIKDLVTLFERWPNTGVVGLRGYVNCYHETASNSGSWFKDPVTGIVAHWVQRVDMSPMAFRRTALLHVGGMDETLSEPGMCGIISDWEICHRMWTAGWEVMAAMPVQLEHDHQQPGGTHKPATQYKCWGLQMGVAGQVMTTHGDIQWEAEMCDAARRLNLERLQLLDETKCPYKAGCKL